MTTRRSIGALIGMLILALGLLAPASPASADAVPAANWTLTDCGVDVVFTNPTTGVYSFDYRVDDQDGTPDQWSEDTVGEGPLAGQKFGLRYQKVTLQPGGSDTADVVFDSAGKHTVAYRLARGPEQNLYLDWVTVEFDVPESCEPTTEPTAEPTVGPTAEPTAGPGAEPTTDPGAPGGGGGDQLPVTGAAAGGLAAGAVLLLAAGVVLYVVARRRRVTFTA